MKVSAVKQYRKKQRYKSAVIIHDWIFPPEFYQSFYFLRGIFVV